jgi:adenine-specific DNA-methyltransferase
MNAPATQGIKYAGSKLRLLPHILELARSVGARSVLDGFAGTTRVGQAFALDGARVISNDVAVWSGVFADCYLMNELPAAHYAEIIGYLNALPPRDGWFTENYGGDPATPGTPKRPWQIRNTRKLDAIRDEIDRLGLRGAERNVVLTSLILALDAVDSTIGHYAAYLGRWSARSFGTLELKVPALIERRAQHEVRHGDIFEAVRRVRADLAYLDPPYGSNNEKMPPSRLRYAAYYHLWTTVVLNDRPTVFGKANRREDSRDPASASVFEDFRRDSAGGFRAVAAIERLIRETNAGHILLSYSSGGRATAESLHRILSRNGRIIATRAVDHRRNVMAAMRWTNRWTDDLAGPNLEYLFLLEK